MFCIITPSQATAVDAIMANGPREAAQQAPDLVKFAALCFPRLPRRPRASQNLRAITVNPASYPTPLAEAMTYPWLAWDSETHRNTLIIDIDHSDAFDCWLALPEAIRPMLISDPVSGRAHAVALLADPVLLRTRAELRAERTGSLADLPESARALIKPQKMADLACRLLAAALEGTLRPPGSLTQSPWGRTENLIGTRRRIGTRPMFAEQWETIQAAGLMWNTLPGAGLVKLGDVVGALKNRYWYETASASPRFSTQRFAKKRGAPSCLSRNSWVFDSTRWWAYDHAERDGGAILDQARADNATLTQPIPDADVRAIARSITRFMNTRYRPRHGADTTRGRDRDAGLHLDVKSRQQLAGTRSAAARRIANDARIVAAIAAVKAEGSRVTQAAVAKHAGLSVNTVAGRWSRLSNPQDAALSGDRKLPLSESPSTLLEKGEQPGQPNTPQPLLAGIIAQSVVAMAEIEKTGMTLPWAETSADDPLLPATDPSRPKKPAGRGHVRPTDPILSTARHAGAVRHRIAVRAT